MTAIDALDRDAGYLARDLLIPVPGIPVSMPCGDAVALLLAQPGLSCLAVVGADGKPVGLVEREQLLSTFSDPLRSELYRRRPIRKFLRGSFLAVDATTHVDEIGSLIASHHPAALTTGFIVIEDGRYAGIGSGIGLLSKVVALTRRRSAEFEDASTLAEAATRAKSSFLAAMSHEIRTPLNSVIGNLELVEDAQSHQERTELIGAALSSAQTLLHILGDVLDFSKIETDHIQLESTATSPASILRDVATQLLSKARERGVALTVQVGGGVPDEIFGDPLRLRQIILNMAGNALKFTAEGRIALSVTRVWAETTGVRLRFEVADTGAGFAPERAARLFEAFTQEEASIGRRFGGTGLGLAISRKLVEAMGGTIGADGAPGGGATFRFEIPVSVVAEAKEEPGSADLGGARVLVIGSGDEAGATADALHAAGAWVDRVDGLDLADSAGPPPEPTYAVIVLAARSSDTAAIVATSRWRPVGSRLVLTYPATDPGLARNAFRHGFDEVVMRPCPPAEVCRAVAATLRQTAPEPLTGAAAAQTAKPAALGGRGGGWPLLVIDDTAMNRAVVRRQLDRLGLTCDLAEDGAQGLDLATTRRYAAILVDCWMPVMDGYEFTRRFRAWEAETGTRTPVIAMTAHALTEDIGTSLEAGMDYHLIKPVMLAHLAMVLEHWLAAGPDAQARPETIQPSAPIPALDPIDLTRLSAILGETDRDELREVLDLFAAHAGTQLERLKAAVANRDRTAIGAAAHAARGAARNAAAVALIPILGEIEAGADAMDWDSLTAAMAAAATALDSIRDFITQV